MKWIGLLIALIIAVRVCPQETIIDYAGMTTVVVMQSGKTIRCHEAKVNYDNTTTIIVHNSWGSKIKKVKSGEIKNLLHINDIE